MRKHRRVNACPRWDQMCVFMRRHEMRQCLLIGGVVAFTGCGAYLAPDRNISDQIEDSALYCTWRLTPRSVELFKRGGLEASNLRRYTVATDVIAAESVNLGQRHF